MKKKALIGVAVVTALWYFLIRKKDTGAEEPESPYLEIISPEAESEQYGGSTITLRWSTNVSGERQVFYHRFGENNPFWVFVASTMSNSIEFNVPYATGSTISFYVGVGNKDGSFEAIGNVDNVKIVSYGENQAIAD